VTMRYAPRNLQGLPTLTEVIEVDAPGAPATLPVDAPPDGARLPEVGTGPVVGLAPDVAPVEPAVDEERLVGSVLAELQRHADLMLEYRLREAIDPALSRLADGLVRDLREELVATLRDVVGRAVSQELARQRGRQA
jgi:hypothetical protein